MTLPLAALATDIGQRLLARAEWLALAESCTGGLIAKTVTDIAGSSGWFERGLVTYSNRAKQELLGVPAATLDAHGAVSAQTVQAMVEGLLRHAPVDWGIAVTGVAGPGGGSADKPVGTVWLAWLQRGGVARVERQHFNGDRDAVRQATAEHALRVLQGLLADG